MMNRIRVLQLVEDLKRGGAEKVITDIALGLDEKQYDARVWCVSRGGIVADELREKGVDVRILGISGYHNPIQILRLAARLKKEKPDILHSHGYFAGVIGRLAAKLAGIPVLIHHVHSTYWDYKQRNIRVERFLGRWTDHIVCCSRAVKDFVTEVESIDSEKVGVIYNGVNAAEFSWPQDTSSIREELDIEKGARVIGTVSSLVPHKGHTFLIRALPQIREKFPSLRCLVIGDGPLKDSLKKEVSDLGLSLHVKFAGARSDVHALLSLLEVFVLASLREGLGIAAIEAMAAAKPVVAADTGGIPEVVMSGETGLLVDPRDTDALATAILTLLDTPEKAMKMGQKGKERVLHKFQTQRMISEIEELYQSQIARIRR